ncbi:MAG: stage V sporulation protein AD [Ruminococcaceae bacterium]|nr:stage V sporulation protein AD [Oscillospiraceae bacterium]
MGAEKRRGVQTIFYEKPPVILGTGSVAGKKESEGPIGSYFDVVAEDNVLGEKTWEKAESAFARRAASEAFSNSGVAPDKIHYLFGGDLLNQCTGTSYGIRDFGIPFIGLYGACSTMALGLSMAASFIDGGYADFCAAITSSHFCSAEKQFRFPLEYGGQRPPGAQWTVTGSACAVVGSDGEGPVIDCVTNGRIVDMGITDANNMGAAMAPAAVDTLLHHFKDTGRTPDYYDLIVSGDLGLVGKSVVVDMLRKTGYDLSQNYNDCGLIIFDREKQDTHAGGSGCACAGLTFCGYLYKLLKEKQLHRLLFMATGALQSTLSVQQGESMPGVAHAVSIVVPS